MKTLMNESLIFIRNYVQTPFSPKELIKDHEFYLFQGTRDDFYVKKFAIDKLITLTVIGSMHRVRQGD